MSDQALTLLAYGAATVASFVWPPYAALFFAGAGMVYSYLNQPEDMAGPRLGDVSFSGSSYGLTITRGWGTYPTSGVYIWAPDLYETSHSEGGKGGGPEITTYSYSASFAVLLCEGPVTAIRKIWFDTTLVYDASLDNALYKLPGMTIYTYLGDNTQLADPVIEAVEGVGQVPSWRGYCYFVVDHLQLKAFGNRRPNVRAEVVRTATPVNQSSVYSGMPVSGLFYNPADDSIMMTEGSSECPYVTRYDPVTGNLLSTSPPLLGTGDIASSDWRCTMDVNPYTGRLYGAVYIDLNHSMAVSRTAFTGGTVNVSPCKNKSCNDGAFYNVFYQEYDGSVYYIFVTALYATSVYKWMPASGKCCPDATLFTGSYDIQWYTIDSNGNHWAMPRTDTGFAAYEGIMFINGASYNLVSLLGISGVWRTGLQWDVLTQTMLFCSTGGTLYKVSFNGSTVTLEGSLVAAGSLFNPANKRWNREPFLWMAGPLYYYKIDVETLTIIDTVSPITNPYVNSFFHEATNSIIGSGGLSTFAMRLDRVDVASETLQNVVSAICTPLSANEFDVSDLTGNVRGFVVTRSEQIRSTLGRLFATHLFGSVESDGKIKFVHYPKNPVATITENELAAHAYGSSTPDQFVVTREPELTFAKRVEVSYMSRLRDYETMTQGSSKFITPSTKVSKVQVVEVLSDDEAKRLSEIMLHSPREERNGFEFKIGNEYMYLDPFDEVNLVKDGNTYRVRISQIDWSEPGILKVQGVSTQPAAFVSTATGATGTYTGSTIPNVRGSIPWLMDIPLVDETQSENEPGFNFGISAETTSWPGASMFRLSGSAATIGTDIGSTSVEVTAGVAMDVLASHNRPTVWDTTSTVEIQLYNGTLSSSTDANVINGANAAVLGNEIIQFVNVTDNGGGSYTLDRFLRGRRGTEWAIDSHGYGDEFVLLDSTAVQDFRSTMSTHNAQFYYRAVTWGASIDRTYGKYFTNTNRRLMPFSGTDPNAEILATGSGQTIEITWTRRTRVFFPYDYSIIPLGETTELYEVDIRSVGGTTVLRTLTATTPSVQYTQSQRSADFTTSPSNFEADIYQVSATVGRGHALTIDMLSLGLTLPVYSNMSQYVLDVQPTDWTFLYDLTWATLIAQANSGATGGAVLNMTTSLNTKTIGTWDSAGIHKDCEVLAKIRSAVISGASEHYWNGICVRQQAYTSREAYVATIDGSGNGRLWHVNSIGTTWTQIGSTVSLGLTNATDTWVRLRAEGTSLKVKWWQGGIGSEPGAWGLEATDSTLLAEGLIGFSNRRISAIGSRTFLLDEFAVAFQGNTATFG